MFGILYEHNSTRKSSFLQKCFFDTVGVFFFWISFGQIVVVNKNVLRDEGSFILPLVTKRMPFCTANVRCHSLMHV